MSDLFPDAPRRPPRVMMHVSDAGDGSYAGAPHIATFRCIKCGYETDWMPIQTISEGRRGKPCPKCN
jgi:hypothetical protein